MKPLKLYIFMLLPILMGCKAEISETPENDIVSLQTLKESDLLFVAKKGDNAITDVTQGVYGLKIDHVAIFHHTDSIDYALEAIPIKGVVLTSLDAFIKRSVGKDGKAQIVVGRVVADFDMEASMRNAQSYIGRPYDYLFNPDDNEIYCSELVQKSYVKCNGDTLFSPIPMTFRDKDGNIPDYWKQQYEKLNKPVPEGAPGSNPGDLSRRPELKIGYKMQ